MPLFLLPILSWIWKTCGKYLVMAGAALAAIGGFAFEMFRKGEKHEDVKQKAAIDKTINLTKEADKSVQEMSDSQVDQELQRWETKEK